MNTITLGQFISFLTKFNSEHLVRVDFDSSKNIKPRTVGHWLGLAQMALKRPDVDEDIQLVYSETVPITGMSADYTGVTIETTYRDRGGVIALMPGFPA